VNVATLAAAAGFSLAAGVCAAADGALLSIDVSDERLPPHLRALAAERERTHRALAFARVAAHLATGTALARAFDLASGPSPDAVLATVLAGVLAVLLAESLARSVGDALGAAAAGALYPVIVALRFLLAPVVLLGSWLDRLLERMLPHPPTAEDDREAAQQFRQVVAAEAEVSREDELLLHGVFSLGDTAVHEIMVPRVDIVGIDRSSPWSEVLDRVRSSEHARFPVYDGSLDDISGILYAKDLLPTVIAYEPPVGGWTSLVRPAAFIPRTKSIDQQLRDFQSSRAHIAIVVDEFGGTAGLVTIEDVLEEIVGEIRDEYDVEEAPIEQRDGRRYWVSGRLTVDELSELLGHDFAREDVTTVGGLVYELLGRVPEAGEEFVLDGFRVVIERVVRRRVERVYFERTPQLTERAS
jgi:CBS domain containing-hemolysin-like protein